MFGLYSQSQVQIEGKTHELYALSNQLVELKDVVSIDLLQPPDDFMKHYELFFSKLVIQSGRSNKIKVVQDNDALVISGDENVRFTLAETIKSVAQGSVNNNTATHSHIEYFLGERWIDPDSLPLVIWANPP